MTEFQVLKLVILIFFICGIAAAISLLTIAVASCTSNNPLQKKAAIVLLVSLAIAMINFGICFNTISWY